MRRQLSLDPLSARAERCVTERGARTGLTAAESFMSVFLTLVAAKNDLTVLQGKGKVKKGAYSYKKSLHLNIHS